MNDRDREVIKKFILILYTTGAHSESCIGFIICDSDL